MIIYWSIEFIVLIRFNIQFHTSYPYAIAADGLYIYDSDLRVNIVYLNKYLHGVSRTCMQYWGKKKLIYILNRFYRAWKLIHNLFPPRRRRRR